MNYTMLLNRVIGESGLSANEICRRCQANGVQLKSNYLSELRNDEARRPSEEISRMIAVVCGKPEDWLVTQAQLDNASEMIQRVIDNLRAVMGAVTDMIYVGVVEPSQMGSIKEAIDKLSDLEFLEQASAIDLAQMNMVLGAITGGYAAGELGERKQLSFPVLDDAMAPTIPKGSTVRVEVCEYRTGDLVCYRGVGSDAHAIRQLRYVDEGHEEVMMIPFNTGYAAEVLQTKNLLIYGKIKQVVIDLP